MAMSFCCLSHCRASSGFAPKKKQHKINDLLCEVARSPAHTWYKNHIDFLMWSCQFSLLSLTKRVSHQRSIYWSMQFTHPHKTFNLHIIYSHSIANIHLLALLVFNSNYKRSRTEKNLDEAQCMSAQI